MQLSQTKKAKVILFINFLILLFIIVNTPSWIKTGIWNLSEEAAEGFFLAMEFFALMNLFLDYCRQGVTLEKKLNSLNKKLEKKEKELLSTLEYLGKVNIQFSLIRSIVKATKVPRDKNELQENYSQLLKTATILTQENLIALRIIDLDTGKTLSEYPGSTALAINIGNRELVNLLKRKDVLIKNYQIFYSVGNNINIKAFLIIPLEKTKKINEESEELLAAVASRCEINYLLFQHIDSAGIKH